MRESRHARNQILLSLNTTCLPGDVDKKRSHQPSHCLDFEKMYRLELLLVRTLVKHASMPPYVIVEVYVDELEACSRTLMRCVVVGELVYVEQERCSWIFSLSD